MWNIEFAPEEFTLSANWLYKAYPKEDILQLSHIYANSFTLDVGFYEDVYKVQIIQNENWEQPIEEFSSTDIKLVQEKVYECIDKYATGFI